MYDSSMEIDAMLEGVRRYLREHFDEVKDEPPQGNSYVFSIKLPLGVPREFKVHRNMVTLSGCIPAYLQENNLAGQLEGSNVQITNLLRLMNY